MKKTIILLILSFFLLSICTVSASSDVDNFTVVESYVTDDLVELQTVDVLDQNSQSISNTIDENDNDASSDIVINNDDNLNMLPDNVSPSCILPIDGVPLFMIPDNEITENDFIGNIEVINHVINNESSDFTIFVCDDNGMGIANKEVLLNYGVNCTASAITDGEGYAHFIDVPQTTGFFEISVVDTPYILDYEYSPSYILPMYAIPVGWEPISYNTIAKKDFINKIDVVDHVCSNGYSNITVLICDDNGMGIANKEVLLNYGVNCTASAITDGEGYAHFIDVPQTTGAYSISVPEIPSYISTYGYFPHVVIPEGIPLKPFGIL